MTTTPPPPRSSRRNHPSLSHLHLAPLSTSVEDSAHTDDTSASGAPTPPWRQSYIAGKSAPTTPSILSRSSSRSRVRQLPDSKSYTQLAFNDDLERGMKRAKGSKSSGRKKTPTSRPGEASGDWLFRAGTAISDETRSSKGQAWLVNRASSTSLVDQGSGSDDDDETATGADVPRILSPDTDRRQFQRSARSSRNASRTDLHGLSAAVPSARSTRGSRTSMHSADEADDYFGTRRDRAMAAAAAGPDFVDGADDDAADDDNDSAGDSDEDPAQQAADEAEIGRLARARGGLFDHILSWALFPDEEAADEGMDGDAEVDDEDAAHKAAAQHALGRLRNARAAAGRTAAAGAGAAGEHDGVSGWTDAAWLLSVASKVIF